LLGWFATAVVLAVVKRNQRAWTLAGLTVVGSALLLAFNDTLWERGLSWRPWIWNHVLERVAEAPWLGHGVGDELLIVIPQNGWLFYDPHNMHLAVLYFTGIIGLALWALLWLFIGQAVWRQRHTPEGLLFLGLLVYGFVASCFDGGYLIERPRENWFILWLPLVLAARLMDPPPKGDA
jgi:O-antigen ligase